jgi:SAM-dependent methyltransferase
MNRRQYNRLLAWAEAHEADFGEEYFESGRVSGYVDYSWKPELISARLKAILAAAGIPPGGRVLDFGCAKGFYVRGLRELGYNAIGVDISTYAVGIGSAFLADQICLLKNYPLLEVESGSFDLTIAKDVLEHLPRFALRPVIQELKRISKVLLVAVPVCDSQRNYINQVDARDLTHRIRLTRENWGRLLGGVEQTAVCSALKGDKSQGAYCCVIVTLPVTPVW